MNIKIKKSHEYMVKDIKSKEAEGRKIKITDSQIIHQALEEFYFNNYKDKAVIHQTKNNSIFINP